MYTQITSVPDSTSKELLTALEDVKWKTVKGSGADFKTWHGVDIKHIQLPWPVDSWSQVFFLSIPPGGKVHRHKDTPRPEETYHIPIKTNGESISYMYPDGIPEEYNLEVGKIYHVDSQIKHDYVNNGDTYRLH